MAAGWKTYARLHKKKARDVEKLFIVEGVRLCMEALRSEWQVAAAFASERFVKSEHWQQFEDFFLHRKIECRTLAEQNFARLADTESPQGIVLVMALPSHELNPNRLRRSAFVVILEGVRDPGNVGTLIRTADWYGVDHVVLSADCVDPYNSKVLRSSMGSIFNIPVSMTDDLQAAVAVLKEHHFRVLAATLNGRKALHSMAVRKPIALVLGGEARGVSAGMEAIADRTVKIWHFGKAESLNVAVAGGVMMNHIAIEMNRAKLTTGN